MRHEPGDVFRLPSAPHARIASRVSYERRRIATLSRAAVACLQAEAVMSSREDIAAIRSASLKLSPNATAGETQVGQRNTDEAVPERERLMSNSLSHSMAATISAVLTATTTSPTH